MEVEVDRPLIDRFATPIASELSGVTVATLLNWSKRGFLKPTFPGCRGQFSHYSFRDLIALRVARELSARGIEIHCLKRVVAYLRHRKGLDLSASDVLASTLLVTDGHDVYEIDGQVGISTLRKPNQAVMLVPLGLLVAEVQTAAQQLSGTAAA